MDNREHQSPTAQFRRITAMVGVLLLTATLLGTVTVSADPALPAGGVRQEAIVKVEVTVRDATQAALLASRGYDCAVGLCELELPDGEEWGLSELGLSVRPLARAIKVTGDARSLASSAAAADESYVWGSNDSPVSWSTVGLCTAIDITTAPTSGRITRNVVTALVSSGRVSDLELYLWDPPDVAMFWNRQGGYTDQGLDDDPETDSDVDLRGRQTTVFAGQPPNRHWYFCAGDDVDGYGGTLQRWSMYVYYCLAPLVPWSMSPANGATNVSPDRDLDWSADPLTQSWDVYFGTTNPPPFHGSATSNTYALPTLSCGTHYYWKVVGHNDCGTTDGPVWDFTTIPPPTQPSGPSPAHGATNQSLGVDLDWADVPGAASYDVYFSTSPLFKGGPAGNTTSSSFALGALTCGLLYYWKVVAKSACGTMGGPIWEFTTSCVPAVPFGPYPANGANNVPLAAELDWANVAGATSYDVYFGVGGLRPPPLVGNTTLSSYAPGPLASGTHYHWRVVAKCGCGESSASSWEFDTAVVAPTPTATRTASPTTTHTLLPGLTPTRTATPTATRTRTTMPSVTPGGTPWANALYLPLLRR